MSVKKENRKYVLVVFILAIIGFNVVLDTIPYSIDLTEDKRFSLSEGTEDLLASIKSPILAEILYDGDLPAGYKRLQIAVKDIIRKFRSYNSSIRYIVANPEDGDVEVVQRRMEAFAKMGLTPFPITYPGEKEFRAINAFPYVVFSQDKKTVIVPLLEESSVNGYDENQLNEIVSGLEYKFINAIQKITQDGRRKIGVISSIGGLAPSETRGIEKELSKFYQVARFSLDSIDLINPEIELLIMPRPAKQISEQNLFAIDQYVMNGGNVIWLLNMLDVNLDSIGRNNSYIPTSIETGVSNLLFKYGVRVNYDLVVDRSCGQIPINIGNAGGRPQMELFPWYYHVIPNPNESHPITKNLGPIKLLFPSSIDTLRTKNKIQKTFLLQSSNYANKQQIPKSLSFDILGQPLQEDYFNQSGIPLAVILEGSFPSFFNNRMTDKLKGILKKYRQEKLDNSSHSVQIVVSDADFVKSDYSKGREIPLGFDLFESKSYDGSVGLLLNSVEYIMGNSKLLNAKSKKIKLRLLDTVKTTNEKSKWQMINLMLPLLFLFGFGILFNWYRRRKYAS